MKIIWGFLTLSFAEQVRITMTIPGDKDEIEKQVLEVDTVTNLHWAKGCNQAVTFDLEKEKAKDFFEKFRDHPAGDDMGFDIKMLDDENNSEECEEQEVEEKDEL